MRLYVLFLSIVLVDGLHKLNRDYIKGLKDGDYTDKIIFTTKRKDDPDIWFGRDHPKFEYTGQFWIGDTRYIKGQKVLRTSEERLNEISEDPDVEELRKSKEILWIAQERAQVRVKRTADPNWNDAWHLRGLYAPSMNIENAWQRGYTGRGIVCAVVDDALQTNHTDLADNVDTDNGLDVVDGDKNPYPPSNADSHGTKVAGLIAAVKDNNVCTVGAAYNTTLIGVRILGSTENNETIVDSMEAEALSWKPTYTDIYSNSWGPVEETGFYEPGTITKDALITGITTGRGGKGSIYVWAAGNGQTRDNCNADGYASSIYTIAITSVDTTKNAWYSEVCAPALAVTYGGSEDDIFLTTTTLYSSCTSTGIQGTSYATPVASAIIALTLEANLNLTWRDIQHLIVVTSKRHNFTDDWSEWQRNGAHKEVSQTMGFGLMDADAMVYYGSTWTTVPTQQTCTTSSLSVSSSTTTWSSSTLSVGSSDCPYSSYLEHVTAEVSFSYSAFRGLTLLNLVSPQGTTSQLLTYRYQDAYDNSQEGSLTWTFMSVQFWREALEGNWTLEFGSNNGDLSTGWAGLNFNGTHNGNSMGGTAIVTLDSWQLTFYGTTEDPLANLDLCSESPCLATETCVNLQITYVCCPLGYTGVNCTEEVSTSSTQSSTTLASTSTSPFSTTGDTTLTSQLGTTEASTSQFSTIETSTSQFSTTEALSSTSQLSSTSSSQFSTMSTKESSTSHLSTTETVISTTETSISTILVTTTTDSGSVCFGHHLAIICCGVVVQCLLSYVLSV